MTDPASQSLSIEGLLDAIADRIAERVAQRLAIAPEQGDAWLDTRSAAEYLGVHRDTLRKLAAAGTVPSEQDGPACKRYFNTIDLDRWRASGRRFHAASKARKTYARAGYSR